MLQQTLARVAAKGAIPRARLLVLAGCFLLTRLVNLTLPGLYYDEATYLYWGHVIGADWSQRYIGAGAGGKQPLHAWLVALSERLFSDPVFAGRAVSVAAGALAMIALWLLAKRLFSSRVATLAAVLYILCPFTMLFDRMAMLDSLLAAEALWLIYLSIRLLDRLELWVVAALALTFAAALLTKSVSVAFLLLLPATLLAARPGELARSRLLSWLAALLIALATGFAIYHVVFGATDASRQVADFERNYGRYTMSPSELLALPWHTWKANTVAVLRWSGQLLTVPLSLAAVIALLAVPRLGRGAWLLAVWTVLPVAGHVAIAARFFDRYLLFAVPPLLILTARFLEWSYERLSASSAIAQRTILTRSMPRALAAIFIVVLLLPSIVQGFGMLTDAERANDATDGFYGLWGLRDYVIELASANPLYIIVNDSPAPIEDGTAVLLRDVPNVKVLRLLIWDGKPVIFDPVGYTYTGRAYPKAYFEGESVYYVSDESAEADSWPAGRIGLVQSFANLRRDGGGVGLYRVRFDDTFP